MAHGGNQRNVAVGHGANDRLLIKGPQVFQTAAAPGHDQQVGPWQRAAPVQSVKTPNSASDLFGGPIPLH